MYTPVLIIGTGIAGMTVAYNLEKNNIKYSIITKSNNYLKSNSTIAPANMRVFDDYEQGINFYMKQCNGNYEMINSIYSNQNIVVDTLEKLNIKYRKTPIGIMPNDIPGGYYIIKNLAEHIENIMTDTVLLDMKTHKEHIECLLYNKIYKKFSNINCNAIVFSAGGFSSLFKYNDNSDIATGDCTYILQRETNKLKGISTVMFHPFSIKNGTRILVGDIVSCLDEIYERDDSGEFHILKIKEETYRAIKNNAYHSNEIFSDILNSIKGKNVYIKFKDENMIKEKLKKHGYSLEILDGNMINVMPTAHYTSGGFEVDKNFKLTDRIFANGEMIFDGDRGIGRLPGHPFTSAIVSGRIIANEIKKIKMNVVINETNFKVKEKININDESEYLKNKAKLEYFSENITNSYLKDLTKSEHEKIRIELEQNIEELKEKMKCVKELQIYYSLKLLYDVIKEKIKLINGGI